MALPREACNVIEDKQRVTPIDLRLTPQREITCVNVKVVYRENVVNVTSNYILFIFQVNDT